MDAVIVAVARPRLDAATGREARLAVLAVAHARRRNTHARGRRRQ